MTTNFDLKMYRHRHVDTGWEVETVKFPDMQILLFCAVLTSSDTTAAVDAIEYHEQPKLYSIVKGAGTLNDIGSIVLFNCI